MGACTVVSFIDLTRLKVCLIRSEHSNKVFTGLATKGQFSIGSFGVANLGRTQS
ncbi:MAG TPA: transposase [Prolixibacteraceae bacterium]|nr:transposase [Prolixibacteraceae bacterium]